MVRNEENIEKGKQENKTPTPPDKVIMKVFWCVFTFHWQISKFFEHLQAGQICTRNIGSQCLISQ